jgi:LuxR family transcriptional regulator, maltose regulon positive regulatory protein
VSNPRSDLRTRKQARRPFVVEKLLNEPIVPKGAPQDEATGLSPKEGTILRLLAEAHSNKELARKLFVTENTLETHLRRIYGKLGIHSRTRAVVRALELGLI